MYQGRVVPAVSGYETGINLSLMIGTFMLPNACSSSKRASSLPSRISLGWIRSAGLPELPRKRESLVNMGKVPVRLKEVVYTLSPYHQQVMAGLWKDVPYKLGKKFHENWVSAFTLVVPIVGTYMYAENYREKEKLHHRY